MGGGAKREYTRVAYLREMSNNANGETDEQIQDFFDAFNI